jgi:hypothetical protein
LKQLFLAAIVAAFAGWGTPASADDAERMRLAREIMATRSDEAEMQYFDASLPYYMNAIEQSLNISDRERERLPDMLREEYRATLAPAREHSAATYARIFTEAELRQILDFYKSDAGRKFLERQTEIQQDGIDLQELINTSVLQGAAERLISARQSNEF